jgi:chitodextrinase
LDDYSDEKYYVYDNIEPTVPSELTVVDSGLDSIEISWASSADNISVRGYEVYANGELMALVNDQSGEEYQTYNIENLDYAEEYKIFVRAYDYNYNRSDWSEPLYAYLKDNVPPTVPKSLEAMKKTDNQITVSWYASEDNVGVTGYEIYVNGELYDEIEPNDSEIEIYTLKNLKTYQLYKINVRAYDEAANYSEMSNLLQVRTTDSIAPSVPTSLKVDNQKLNSFRLKWNCSRDNVAIKNYIVEHNQKVIATTTSPECMVNVTKAVPGTTYQLSVRAVDLAGNKSALSTRLSYKFTAAFAVKNNKLHLNQDVINLGNGIVLRKISKNDYLVPIKAVYQSLGYNVATDTKKKTVVVTKSGSPTIQFSTDTKTAGTAKVNGTPVKLASPVTTVNGVTMAPLSFIAKSVGVTIQP